MLFGNLIMICRQRLCSSAQLKNRGFRVVKFKSSCIKAKRPLEQIQKTEGEKKMQFFWFSGFCMDFLGNQTRMNFPGNRMGDGFSWESNGGCKNNNNNMIRLVPARIESGRGKQGFCRDSVAWRTTSEKAFLMRE